MSVPGLPEYDYPSPWSLQPLQSQQDVPNLPEFDYPMPFMVKNTFIGASIGRPSSLEGFFEERLTQSCPVSEISAPPGLEDMVEPAEAAARFIALEAAHRRDMEARDYFQSTSTFGQPRSQFHSETEFLPPSLQHQPPFNFHPMAPSNQGQPLPILLDSLLAGQSPQQPEQSSYFNAQYNASCAPPAPQEAWATQQAEPEVGSLECPTIGSKGHFYGTCKPCAFLYTKGCGNGASCSFCHLCDVGEKKRRGKEKRAAKQTFKRQEISTIMGL